MLYSPAHIHTHIHSCILLTTKANMLVLHVTTRHEKQIWCALFQSVSEFATSVAHRQCGVYCEEEKKKTLFRLAVANSTRKNISGFIYCCAARRDERVYIVCALLRRYNIFFFNSNPIESARSRCCVHAEKKPNILLTIAAHFKLELQASLIKLFEHKNIANQPSGQQCTH